MRAWFVVGECSTGLGEEVAFDVVGVVFYVAADGAGGEAVLDIVAEAFV